MLGTDHCFGLLKIVFQLKAPRGTQYPEPYLAYVEGLDIVSQEDPISGRSKQIPNPVNDMYVLKRKRRPNGDLHGEVVQLQQVTTPVECCPKFGENMDKRLKYYNSYHLSENFYLNHFCDPEVFYMFTT